MREKIILLGELHAMITAAGHKVRRRTLDVQATRGNLPGAFKIGSLHDSYGKWVMYLDSAIPYVASYKPRKVGDRGKDRGMRKRDGYYAMHVIRRAKGYTRKAKG